MSVSTDFHIRQFNDINNQISCNGPLSNSQNFCARIGNIALTVLALMVWIPSAIIYGLGQAARSICCISTNEQPQLPTPPSPPSSPLGRRIVRRVPQSEPQQKIERDVKENPFSQPLAVIGEDDDFRKTVEGRYDSGVEDEYLVQSLLATRQKIIEARGTDTPPLKVFIAGGGPAGLLAAFHAYLGGAIVTLAEPRPDFTRDQILRINLEAYADIAGVIGGDMLRIVDAQDFLSHRFQGQGLRGLFTESNYWVAEIKDLQYIVYALLKRLETLNDNLKNRELTILGGHEFVGFDEGRVRIRNRTTFDETLLPADWVCGADGAHSAVAEAAGLKGMPVSSEDAYIAVTFDHPYADDPLRVEMQDNKDPKVPALPAIVSDGIAEIRAAANGDQTIEHRLQVIELARQRTWIVAEQEILNKTISDEHLNEWHRRMRTIKDLDTATDLDTVRRGVAKHLAFIEKDAKWQWSKKRMPITRFFTSPKTVYLGCEIPKPMLEIMQKDKDEALRWVKTVLRAHLAQPIIDKLKCRKLNVFPVQLMRREHAYKNFESDQKDGVEKVFLAGDALATPHFLTGSGAVAGMKVAKLFAKLVKDVQADRKNEKELLKQYRLDVSKVITAMQNKAFPNMLTRL